MYVNVQSTMKECLRPAIVCVGGGGVAAAVNSNDSAFIKICDTKDMTYWKV